MIFAQSFVKVCQKFITVSTDESRDLKCDKRKEEKNLQNSWSITVENSLNEDGQLDTRLSEIYTYESVPKVLDFQNF
jgi:hypothetical protein